MMAQDTKATSAWTGVWLTIVVLVFCVAAFVIALGFVPATTRYFPVAVSGAAIVVALFDIVRRGFMQRHLPEGETHSDFLNEGANAPAAAILGYAAWFFGYLAAIWVVGIVAASSVFVAAFLKFEAGTRWWTAALGGLSVLILVVVAGRVFRIRWPGALFDVAAYMF